MITKEQRTNIQWKQQQNRAKTKIYSPKYLVITIREFMQERKRSASAQPKTRSVLLAVYIFFTVAFALHVYMTSNYLFRKWNGDKHKWNLNVYTHSKITSRYAFGLSKYGWMSGRTGKRYTAHTHTNTTIHSKGKRKRICEEFQQHAAPRTHIEFLFLWRKTHIFYEHFHSPLSFSSWLTLLCCTPILDPSNSDKSPKNETSSQRRRAFYFYESE